MAVAEAAAHPSFFGKHEREVLEQVAAPVARAIHIAQLREQREALMQKHQRRAESRIGALERMLRRVLTRLEHAASGEPA